MVVDMKKTVSVLLSAALLTSCGEGAVPVTDENTTAAETTAEPVIDNYEPLRNLNFNGDTVTMLIRTQFEYEFYAESLNGEVVNDAVYERDKFVEELLNVNLDYVRLPGSYSERTGFAAAYQNSVTVGDNAYELVASAANYMLPLTSEGYFKNLITTPNVDTEKPWYAQGYIQNMSIDGKLFLVTGSAAINMTENSCVMFFNKDLLNSLGHSLFYDDVRVGTWTFDKLNNLVRDVYSDLNGNSTLDDDDRYGYLTYNNMINAQLFGMGQHYIEKDKDGKLYFKTSLSESDVNAYEKVEKFMNELDSTYHYIDTANNALVATENILKIWNRGNTLFMPQVLSTASKLRDTAFDFGILPMPKYDESQENYRTFILENVTVMGISPTANAPLAGAVLEALSVYGYEDISPKYFEIALKEKYSRDTDTKDMLDIIRDSVTFEYPMITQFMASCIQKQTAMVSGFESQAASLAANFDKLVQGWQELD